MCIGRLKLLAKSTTGEEVAQQIIVVLSTELGINPQFIVAAMRDRAIKIVYNQLLDVGCFFHMHSRSCRGANEYANTSWILQSLDWFVLTKPKVPLVVAVYLHLHTLPFGGRVSRVSLRSFIRCSQPSVMWRKFLENDDLPPATSTKLLQVLNDPAKSRKLKIEIATTVDAMEPFVKATYKLEGDGALSLVAYQQLSMLFAYPALPECYCCCKG